MSAAKRHDFLHSHDHLIPHANEEHVLVDKADWIEARRHFAAMNKSTMNCEQCGRLVSFKTAGEVENERSDLDGALCIVAMWCKRCAANRKELKS